MRTRLVLLLSILALLAGACATDETTTPAQTTDDPADLVADATPAPETEPDADGTTVATASSDLGDIVVDGDGFTLYVFMPDDQGDPTCTDACAQTWPPLEGPATAGEDADDAMLATAQHPSGTTQATYNGWPLYRFANDQAPGDTNGQGLNDVWYVIGPEGEPITEG